MRIFAFLFMLIATHSAFAANNFSEACARDAANYMGGPDSPFSLKTDGTVSVDAKSKCKSSFDKSSPVETYTFTCPKTDPRFNTVTETIKIKRENGRPVEISNISAWKGTDGKKTWGGSDVSRVRYSYNNGGECIVENKELELDASKTTSVTYDRQTCEQINNIPEVRNGDLAKCSTALQKVGAIVDDYSRDLRDESREEVKAGGKRKVFAYDGTKKVMNLIAKCQARGLPEDNTVCPACEYSSSGATSSKQQQAHPNGAVQ